MTLRPSLAEVLDLLDYSGEIAVKEARIPDLEDKRDVYRFWFQLSLRGLHAMQQRNERLSHQLREARRPPLAVSENDRQAA